MKRMIPVLLVVLVAISLCSCSYDTNQTEELQTKTDVEIAREKVIEKYKKEAGNLGTSRYIEDIYKQYPSDETIANIYYYCIAREQYDLYNELSNESYLESAKEYALKIKPSYSGEFSSEMHSFVEKLFPNQNVEEKHEEAYKKENNYNSLTKSEKKAICNYIQSRYDYYDSLNGGYSGDKYSDEIMRDAAERYGLTVDQIKIIWMNMYSY